VKRQEKRKEEQGKKESRVRKKKGGSQIGKRQWVCSSIRPLRPLSIFRVTGMAEKGREERKCGTKGNGIIGPQKGE